ncbi:MAG: ATP-binding response regulator [Anaerolineae bacterium]
MTRGTDPLAADAPGHGEEHVPAPASAPAGLEALFAPTLARVALVSTLLAYFWLAYTFIRRDEAVDWPALLPPLTLAFGAAAAYLLRRRHGLAALAMAAGFIVAAGMEAMDGRSDVAAHLALATVMVVTVLSGPAWAVACAVFLAIATLGMPAAGGGQLLVLRETGFAALLAWALGGDIAQALVRAEASEQRSWQHAREAQQRRGELQRTSKTLRDMYALLERTNHELEVARREAEESKEIKARFAANISHELRTPLNLVMGFSHTMYASPEVYGDMVWPPELRVDIHEIYAASRHLLSMIDDILDLSRIEAQRLPLRLESTNIASLAKEAGATGEGLLRGKRVTMSVNVPGDLPEVMVDRTRIRQVLYNLISNAIRFTDTGEIRVAARPSNGEIEVTVSDTGTGIAAEDLGTIFDEFSQARGPITSGRGGAGLGLAVCREFVQLHGGRIGVDSEVGKGSTFRFTIPLPGMGKARSRVVYYQPEGWSPPLPRNTLGKSAVVLAPDEASARAVARGIPGYRTIPITDVSALPDVVNAEHPAGVILVKDPLVSAGGPTPESIWAASGRTDLGVIEYEMPIESLAKQQLQVEAYLPKPVRSERLVEAIGESQAHPDRFLVVDDDPSFRTLMERVLHSAFPQAQTRLCAGGEEALAVLALAPYDVVILDLLMPGMAGVEFLFEARRRDLLGAAKVMVTTGASYADELSKFVPSRLLFTRKAPPRGTEWFDCIRGLLDAAPPDYSAPGLAPELPGERRPRSAS